MTLYIYTGDDPTIVQGRPVTLPARLRLPNGRWRTAPFNAADLAAAGFEEAPAKPDHDATTERVVWTEVGWAIEPLPEPPEPEPQPLTQIEFITLCQLAGGMTDEMLVASKSDAALAAMWIKFDMAPTITRDAADVQAGIAGLAALGYLPNGAEAVIAAWPSEGQQ